MSAGRALLIIVAAAVAMGLLCACGYLAVAAWVTS